MGECALIKSRIFAVMADRGIHTQKELAERMGCSRSNVNGLVRDNFKSIRRDTLETLCRVLNCQPGDLLLYEPDGDQKG